VAPKPLDDRQRRAASRLGSGALHKDVAEEVGVSPKAIQRWLARDDFRQLVRRSREAEVPDVPTAEAVLLAAMSATRPDGCPDWQSRIAAARALLSAPVTSPDAAAQARAVGRERIYVGEDE
jgi:hypothetical protein